jgi:hypothetical protein
MTTNLKNILLITILLSIGVFTILMFTKVIPYLSFEPAINFLSTKTDLVLQKSFFQWSFYIHVISSWFVMLAGIIQFIPYILKNFSVIHRIFGKIYVFLVLFLAAPSGLGLALYANGGLSTKVGFTFQCIVWWFITFIAWQEIRNRNWLLHTQSMIRSYAITLAAMSLRVLSFVMIYNFGTKPIETYLTVTWLSWVGNLFIAEIFIRNGLAQYLLKNK